MTQSDGVTVLICTWNRAALLRETLASLSAMNVTSTVRWEVVIVDNNSTDTTRDVVERAARTFPVPVRYLFEGRQGKSFAMNAGLRAAAEPIIAFADDDVRVDRDWLASCSAAFRDHPDIDYVGGPVAPIWEAPCPTWFERTGRTLWGTLAILDYGAEPFVFEERQKVPLGANFAVRQTLFGKAGDFNPTLGRNGERVLLGQELPEFFARTRRVGARGMYIPGMRVGHHVPAWRLRPEYFRRWWYGKGISRARMEAIHPVTELGLDLRQVSTVAGIPRFLFGTAARDAARWLKALLRGDRGERFAAETQLWYFGGQLRERLRQR
ncbi:MAG TPA: glycosyltransferase [Thermoanaerobaculia bacterium]|nr:glycosyltransferase [Thermoanaerobaculia bacterium]